MERIDTQRIIIFLLLATICISVGVLGAHLERTERFGNVALALFGSLPIFSFIGKTDMYFGGFTAVADKKSHLAPRIIGFVVGIFIVTWSVSNAVVA